MIRMTESTGVGPRCAHCDNDVERHNQRADCDRCGKSCCMACLSPPAENPLELWCSMCMKVDSGELKPDYLAGHLRNQLIDVQDRLARLERKQRVNP
jgi:hypothetical protein